MKRIRELSTENRRMREAIQKIWEMWQSDEPLDDGHGINEEFGGWIVVAAMEAGLYHPREEHFGREES